MASGADGNNPTRPESTDPPPPSQSAAVDPPILSRVTSIVSDSESRSRPGRTSAMSSHGSQYGAWSPRRETPPASWVTTALTESPGDRNAQCGRRRDVRTADLEPTRIRRTGAAFQRTCAARHPSRTVRPLWRVVLIIRVRSRPRRRLGPRSPP